MVSRLCLMPISVVLTEVSSLSYRLWAVALSRVVVGTGTAGIELLVIVIINGKSSDSFG